MMLISLSLFFLVCSQSSDSSVFQFSTAYCSEASSAELANFTVHQHQQPQHPLHRQRQQNTQSRTHRILSALLLLLSCLLNSVAHIQLCCCKSTAGCKPLLPITDSAVLWWCGVGSCVLMQQQRQQQSRRPMPKRERRRDAAFFGQFSISSTHSERASENTDTESDMFKQMLSSKRDTESKYGLGE